MFFRLDKIIFFLVFFMISTVILGSFQKITVMTAPLGKSGNGHYAVTRSLIDGLKKNGTLFNYNPKNIEDVGDVVVVLANISALRQAIDWKRIGKIKRLLAGPNLMIRADEHEKILASPEVDICLVPSYWVQVAYEEETLNLKGRIQCWYAGVDELFWNPLSYSKKQNDVLIYCKKQPESFCISVENLVRKYGWNSVRLQYGKYSQQQYKEVLSKSFFAIFLSRSESQGLALAEAWAMDVPTLPWNPKELIAHGRTYSLVSSCPYLTDATGIDWQHLDQLEEILKNIDQHLSMFTPRQWVLENMTDKVSAQCLLDIIQSI